MLEKITAMGMRYNFPDYNEPFNPAWLPSVYEVYMAMVNSGNIKRARSVDNSRGLNRLKITNLISDALSVVQTLEEAARHPDKWDIPPEIAESIGLIARFSAPGYHNRPEKPKENPDKYVGIPWARGLERVANDTAARLGIVLAGMVTDQDFSRFKSMQPLTTFDPELNALKLDTRRAINNSRIRFAYFGRPDERAAVKRVIMSNDSFIHPDSVDIYQPDSSASEMRDTYDQAMALKRYVLSKNFPPETGVVVVDTAPRLCRQAYIFAQLEVFPPDIILYLCPVATPSIETSKLIEYEIRGTVALGISGRAALKPCQYHLF